MPKTKNKISPAQDNYHQLYVKKDRALKITKELSEFLRILALNETDILKTMIVRFAIESIEASMGSLLEYDKNANVLRYQDTYLYEDNKIILENYGEKLKDVFIRRGEGIVGEAYIKQISILVENINKSDYNQPVIGDIVDMEVASMIAMPLQVDNEVVAILEIANVKGKPALTPEDVEVITMIANFAATIMENGKFLNWAIHDNLTGLYNSHYFRKELLEEIGRSKRYGRIFSLAMFDIDDFKHVNDTYGHSTGDLALKLLADSILKTVRKEVDIPSRYGGDEFVIVLPNTGAEDAKTVCKRLAELVSQTSIVANNGESFNISLSIGISEFPKDTRKGEEQFDLFNHADEALYHSKRAGKNQITIYKPKPKKRKSSSSRKKS